MIFTKKVLKNGMRVISIPMKDNPAVTVLVMVEAGSKYEDKANGGISHFLEHMCFKGTPKRPKAIDISRELDSVGAHYNAFTSYEYTGYYAKVNSSNVDKAIDIVSDMYINPLFDQSEIDKEKGVIVEEINMYKDMPQRHVADLFNDLLYGDTPAGRSIAGVEEIVKGFNRDDFVKYRKAHYLPKSTVVAIAGSFDQSSIFERLEKAFETMPSGEKSGKEKVIENQMGPAVKIGFKETDQTHLILGVRTFDTFDQRKNILNVLTGVLSAGMSSRLFQRLRDEMGVGYYVRADADYLTDHGNFTVSTGVDNERVDEVIVAILDELKKLKNHLVSEEELRKVKDNMIGSTLLSLETSDSQAEFLAFQEIMTGKLESLEEKAEKINSVTGEQIKDLANQIFISKNLNLALIGNFKDQARFEKLLVL